MDSPIRVILIGAGNRGTTYAKLMKKMPAQYKMVGVAEPIEMRRNYIKELFDLPEEACYLGWEEILAQPKMADLAIIATMDDMHYEPAMKAISLGYNLLLEKPLAPTAEQCANMSLAAEKNGVSVLVCHVLRYAPFFKKVKQLLMEGVIGDVMSVVHVEAVGNLHQSHSYIRGNWHSEKETSPMLLAKSCHDLDIIQWLLNKPCKRVTSFGDLTYFKEENAPAGAPVRCAEGNCPIGENCPYNCLKLYYDDKKNLWFRRAATKGISTAKDPTDEEVMQALMTTDYGLCVFHANNDVVDHQVVNLEFEGGVTVSFSMNAFNKGGRYIRFFGTKGELYANMSDTEITVFNFESREHTMVPVLKTEESIEGGHGGGDAGIINELHQYLSGNYTGVYAADIHISAKNHMIGFAAEEARHSNTVVAMDEYMGRYGIENK